MVKCINCGREISEYASECPHCKTKVSGQIIGEKQEVNASTEKQVIGKVRLTPVIYALICSIITAFLIWLSGLLLDLLLLKFVGDNAVLASCCAKELFGGFTLFAVNVLIMVVIAFIFQIMRSKVKKDGIAMLVLALVGTLISCIGLLALQKDLREVGVPEEIFYATSTIVRQLPYFYGIIMTVFSASALYAMIKLGLKKGLIIASVIFLITMFVIFTCGYVFTIVLGTGVNLIYGVVPAIIVSVFIIITLIFVVLVMSRKK